MIFPVVFVTLRYSRSVQTRHFIVYTSMRYFFLSFETSSGNFITKLWKP